MLEQVFKDSSSKKQRLDQVNHEERTRVSCFFEITAQLPDLNAEQLRALATQMRAFMAQKQKPTVM